MAYIGINANFFDVKHGNPLGTLITNGEWLVGPIYDRAAIGFSKDKDVFIDRVMLLGDVSVNRGFLKKKLFTMFDIDVLNIPCHLYEGIGLFTADWNTEIVLPEGKLAVVVQNGCINKIANDYIEILENNYILVGDNNSVLNSLKKKDCLEIKWKSEPDWSNVVEAISGGPYLIKDGEVYIDTAEEKFNFPEKDLYATRSAIGIGEDKKLYLVVANGKKNNDSVGLTLEQLARVLKKLNLKEAINLDGGGSSTLIVDGKAINELKDHHERKISNGLLIFYDE